MPETDRLDRIEALLAIGQLPHRYAFACDSRDFDSLVALYVDDVTRPDMDGVGREALKAFFARLLQGPPAGMHQIVGHQVDLIDADHATGKVYTRAEGPRGERWVAHSIRYDDVYERRDGVWYFTRRDLEILHVTPSTEGT
jgi:hypothetical protein